MSKPPLLQENLISRYDKPGPRYTSYPPANEFHDRISETDYRDWVRLSNEELIPKPLSLYFHIPFCSSICYYCACNKVITKRKEKAVPYLHDLSREIEIQARLFDADREVRQLHWGGGTPGFLSHQQSQLLMEKIGRHFKLASANDAEFSIEIDPRVIEKGGIAHLHNLGFNRLSIGVQDFNAKVQQAVNRIQDLETTAAVLNDARRFGFHSVNIDLIYGLPHQTAASFAETLDTIIKLDPDRIAIYNYAHLPHRFPPQRRIDAADLPTPNTRLAILQTAIDKLCGAGYEYIGMDHFAKPTDELATAQRNGSLQRNFQGYSAHAQCDMVGLGVSAISQVSDNFSQHTTNLDAYHEELERLQLPIVRGYQSSREDLLRRDIIQSLACHFHLDTKQLANDWEIDFAQHFAGELKQLETMQADGLIELRGDHIIVGATGRLLVRNICMVFDSYQKPERVAGLFSRTV